MTNQITLKGYFGDVAHFLVDGHKELTIEAGNKDGNRLVSVELTQQQAEQLKQFLAENF